MTQENQNIPHAAFSGARILVTGGAGLVGTSLCESLIRAGAEVLCIDNFTLGTRRHLKEIQGNSKFGLQELNVSEPSWHSKLKKMQFDFLFHLAANSDISVGSRFPHVDYERTLVTTFHTLEAARALNVKNFIFASSSAVYGARPVFPTPEVTTQMYPVSLYGAGKLASEHYISAYVENFGLNAWIYRFGNVVGKKLTHGVIYDFVHRLRKDPSKLQVMGNGMQTKTYIDVEDCVRGILLGVERSPAKPETGHAGKFQIINLSTTGVTSVREIAEETVHVVTEGKAQILYGSEPIGWVGDVPKTNLDVSRMDALGFTPLLASKDAVTQSIHEFFKWSAGA